MERPLTWVHGTIINIGPGSDPFDARINVQTRDSVDQTSDLFKFVFPKGPPTADQTVFEFDSLGGQIRFSKVKFIKSNCKLKFNIRGKI